MTISVKKKGVNSIVWLLVVAMCCPGCISSKSGGGPFSAEKAMQVYGNQLGSLSAEERIRFEEIEKDTGKKNPYVRFAMGGSPALKSRMSSKGVWGAIFSCGFKNAKARFVDRIEGTGESVTLYTREHQFIPGYPLIWPVWTGGAESYEAKTGKQVGEGSFFGIMLAGLLGGHLKCIVPAYDKQSAVTQLRDPQQFNVVEMTWVVAGLIGSGRVNHKRYGQFLWIAFPMGDAE